MRNKKTYKITIEGPNKREILFVQAATFEEAKQEGEKVIREMMEKDVRYEYIKQTIKER